MYLQVHAYGKLPFYRDFLRAGSGQHQAKVFRRWLDRGFSKFWETSEQRKEHVIGPHVMLLRLERRKPGAVAYLWGSHDRDGLRRFPFSLCAEIPGSVRKSGVSGEISVLAQFACQCHDWKRQVEGLSSAEDFYEWAKGLTCEVRIHQEKHLVRSFRQTIEGMTVGEFASACYETSAAEKWSAALGYLQRQKTRSPRAELSLRLPRCSALTLWEQILVWQTLISNRTKKPLVASLMCALGSESHGFVLLERLLRDEDVYLFHPDNLDYEYVEDLRKKVPSAKRSGDSKPDENMMTPLIDVLEPGPKRWHLRIRRDAQGS